MSGQHYFVHSENVDLDGRSEVRTKREKWMGISMRSQPQNKELFLNHMKLSEFVD